MQGLSDYIHEKNTSGLTIRTLADEENNRIGL
jgi:hypothetical protein